MGHYFKQQKEQQQQVYSGTFVGGANQLGRDVLVQSLQYISRFSQFEQTEDIDNFRK